MSEPFDPYRKWLGIPPKDQPPHHYRLLGIAAFEDDPDVIENAASRQMAHLRTYQSGKNSAHSQRLLTEISAAKLCLLDPETKATYDERLRDQLAASGKLSSSQVVPPPPEEPGPEVPALPRFGPRWREEGVFEPAGSAVPPVPIPMPPPQVSIGPIITSPIIGAPLAAPSVAAPPMGTPVGVPLIRRSTSASAMARGRRKKSSLPIVITIISLLVLVGAGGIALVLANRQNLEPEPRPNPVPTPTHASNPEAKPKAKPAATGEAKSATPSKKAKPEDEATSFPIGKELAGDSAASTIGVPPPAKLTIAVNPLELRDSIRQELFTAEQGLARRDDQAFRERLTRAEELIRSQELPETAAFKSEAEELRVLKRLSDQFWVNVRGSLPKLQIGEKLGFYGHQLELLARDGEVVEYRYENATHKQPLHELPPQPALLLVSKTLLAEPANLLAAAAFLAVDAKASDDERKFGRQLFALARTLGRKDPAVARKLGLKSADEEIALDANLLPKP